MLGALPRCSKERGANPCPPGTSLNPPGKIRRKLRARLHGPLWTPGGAGTWAVGVCSISPPCLYPSGTVKSKLLLADSPLWVWESKLLVFPEHHCVMGLCPWDEESSVPVQGPFPHGSLKLPPSLAWRARQHFLREALADFPCLNAPTALHWSSEFPLLLIYLSPALG